MEKSAPVNVMVSISDAPARCSGKGAAIGPGAATHRLPVKLPRADVRTTAVGSAISALGGTQFGNFNSRSIAWKRGAGSLDEFAGVVVTLLQSYLQP
jgi:uncharacterized protein YcfJ